MGNRSYFFYEENQLRTSCTTKVLLPRLLILNKSILYSGIPILRQTLKNEAKAVLKQWQSFVRGLFTWKHEGQKKAVLKRGLVSHHGFHCRIMLHCYGIRCLSRAHSCNTEGLSPSTPLQDWRPPTKETVDFKKKKEKVLSAFNTRGGRICLSIPSAVSLRNTISIFTWEAVILDMSYLQHSHTWSDLPGKL